MHTIPTLSAKLYEITLELERIDTQIFQLEMRRDEFRKRQEQVRNELRQLQIKHGNVRNFHNSERMKMDLLSEIIEI